MCRLITWNVDIWNNDLAKVRYTHVRDNNEHCTSMKQVYHIPNIIFSNGCQYCSVVWIEIECTSYIQMHKENTMTDLPAELGFRLNNDSRVKSTAVSEVYTDRMRYVYKDYRFFTFFVA